LPAPRFSPTPRWIQAPEWKRLEIVCGQTIYRSDDGAPQAYILEAGLVKVAHRGGAGMRPSVQIIRPGQLFGDGLCVAGRSEEFTAHATCIVSGHLFAMPRGRFLDACREVPEVWHWFVGQMEARIDAAERRLHQLTHWRVEDRILFLLLEIAVAVSSSDRAEVPLAQHEIARHVAASRETASTVLNNLERSGVVELGRAMVRVPSVRVLRRRLSHLSGTV